MNEMNTSDVAQSERMTRRTQPCDDITSEASVVCMISSKISRYIGISYNIHMSYTFVVYTGCGTVISMKRWKLTPQYSAFLAAGTLAVASNFLASSTFGKLVILRLVIMTPLSQLLSALGRRLQGGGTVSLSNRFITCQNKFSRVQSFCWNHQSEGPSLALKVLRVRRFRTVSL